MKISLTFNNIKETEVNKVANLIEKGIWELSDGNFFGENCEEEGIEQFDSCDFTIEIKND